MSHMMSLQNKKRITLKGILYRNLNLSKKHMSPCSFFFFVLFSFFTSKMKTGMDCHTCLIVYSRSMGVDNHDLGCI